MFTDLQVTPISKKMLSDSLNSNMLWENKFAPFPKSKVAWLLNNTRIDDDDYCFLIAKENEKIIAFIYMIPDLLNTKSDQIKKIYWLISWWVHEDFKKTVLGTYIFNEALRLAKNQILIKSYAEHIVTFYEKQPLSIISSRHRYTIFFSADHTMLIGKFKFLKHVKYVLKKIDSLIASILGDINFRKLNTKGLDYEYIAEIDEKTWQFIEPHCKNDIITKTKEYINWHIDNKQFCQLVIPKKNLNKFAETGASNNIHIHNLKVLKDSEIIGFISFIVNYNEFNVKYFIADNDENYNLCVDALINNFIATKARYIFTDDSKLATRIITKFTTIFTHKVIKKGLVHNDVKFELNDLTLHDRDGHFY